ncbi:nitric oxide reductase transcription regulator [bacterium F16]|nr:nitric oxide reductase transcription regulator [bacterium F16]
MNLNKLLLELALDLARTLGSADRLQRMLLAIRKALNSDAAALLVLDNDRITVRASHGLNMLGQTKEWLRSEQPRLNEILKADDFVIFPDDSRIADPFDGLLDGISESGHLVHSCLGIPLRIDNSLLGCITADALRGDAFVDFDHDYLEALGALASATLKAALERECLEKETHRKTEWAQSLIKDQDIDFLGDDPVTQAFKHDLSMVARSTVQILLTGETGVGKDVAARAAHKFSPRADRPFVAINCAAIPETMLESELFGHEKGAFTGADSNRPGRFEIADGGTLFLDEIGELPLSMQAKLLRVLQDGEVQRLGADRPVRVDVRLMAATNKDLRKEVDEGRFRADLFHRIAVFPIIIPPLRDRKQDIPLLAESFLRAVQKKLHCGPVTLHPRAFERLNSWRWPGNVRELKNVILAGALRASHRAESETVCIELSDIEGIGITIPQTARTEATSTELSELSLKEQLEQFKINIIRDTLTACNGNWSETASKLGIDRSNLHHLAKRLGIR